MILAALLTLLVNWGNPPKLDCPLALEIQEAANTRMIYLDGVFEETDSIVEKVTLAAEVIGLDSLRAEMILWRKANCHEGEIK